jgi:hypothetical protein
MYIATHGTIKGRTPGFLVSLDLGSTPAWRAFVTAAQRVKRLTEKEGERSVFAVSAAGGDGGGGPKLDDAKNSVPLPIYFFTF